MPSIGFLTNVMNGFLISTTLQYPTILFFYILSSYPPTDSVENLGGCG